MNVGEYLKNKREEKGLTLEQVSEGTNIRAYYLQQIEDGKTDNLPSVSQARGFSRLYATYLGLDPKAVFEEVEHLNKPSVPEAGSIRQEKLDISSNSRVSIFEPSSAEISKPPEFTSLSEAGKTKPKSFSQVIFEEIGQDLRKQRESLGLSLADIERQIKIREYYLFVLEQGKVDDLPSTVQGRGMLNNYASFMNLDPEVLQSRYVEGLQQRRIEKNQIEAASNKRGVVVMGKEPLSGWRRFLTPDLLVGGSVFLILFSMIIWGAMQVIKTSLPETVPTVSSISEILVGTEGALETEPVTQVETPIGESITPGFLNTPGVDVQATLISGGTGPIQVVIVAYQRAFLQVTVDGKESFRGRMVPGNVYSYSGSTKITLTTGNAAAVQVYYNQQDLGILGQFGDVISMEFTTKAAVTPTPRFPPTPTITQPATLTPLPTNTPFPTPTVPTATITPIIPEG